MMIERIEPKKIYVYAVVPFKQWNYVKNDEEDKKYLNDFSYWQEYDYAVTAIMVEEDLVFLMIIYTTVQTNFLKGLL